jgi:hypothetical protein
MAARLAEAADAAGWAVQATYARGTKLDRQGGPGKVVDSLAVRLRRGPDRGVAVWSGGVFYTGWTWTTDPVTVPVAAAYRPLLARVVSGAVRDVA